MKKFWHWLNNFGEQSFSARFQMSRNFQPKTIIPKWKVLLDTTTTPMKQFPDVRILVNIPVPPPVKRGLMLMSKILQNIANHVEFSKEAHMIPFNDFLRAHFVIARQFFIHIASDCVTEDASAHSMSFISDTNVLALHRLLYNHQEKIGDYLSSSRDHKVSYTFISSKGVNAKWWWWWFINRDNTIVSSFKKYFYPGKNNVLYSVGLPE